jgi:hypothetical protein
MVYRTFVSDRAQCYVIRSIKLIVAEYSLIHSAFSTFRLRIGIKL